MATELELKLALAPQDVAALRRHPLLAGAKPTRQRLLNTYFDTPELALAKARMTLRLRHIGGVGAGGGTPRPKKDRPDSIKMAAPTRVVNSTMMGGMMLGRR